MYKVSRIIPLNIFVLFIVFMSYSYGLMCLSGCTPDHFIKKETDFSNVKRVAVLPFENFASADTYAGEKIRRIVITELLSRGIDVIEPGEVTRRLMELNVKSLGSITLSDLKEMGKTLNVDAIMRGSVEAFGISKGYSVTYPEVTINLMLIDTSSGNIIWSVRHTSGGASFWTRHFGTEGISLSEAARKVVQEAVDTLF